MDQETREIIRNAAKHAAEEIVRRAVLEAMRIYSEEIVQDSDPQLIAGIEAELAHYSDAYGVSYVEAVLPVEDGARAGEALVWAVAISMTVRDKRSKDKQKISKESLNQRLAEQGPQQRAFFT